MGTWPRVTAVSLSALIAAELLHVIALPPATLVLEGGGTPHILHVDFEGSIEVRELAIATSATHERLTIVSGRISPTDRLRPDRG